LGYFLGGDGSLDFCAPKGSAPSGDVVDVYLDALGDLTSGPGVTGIDSAPILRDGLHKPWICLGDLWQ
jgi:hypothetical protein